MSPPLVVAFALAGRVDIDLTTEPIGKGKDGKDVLPARHLADARRRCATACTPPPTRRLTARSTAISPSRIRCGTRSRQARRASTSGTRTRTYIQEPPFFEDFSMQPGRFDGHHGARAAGDLRRLGDDRPHQPGRRDQGRFAGRHVPAGARRAGRGLQQLRLAPRQRPRDDARHVRQRAHQEPDGARHRGRRDGAPVRAASRCSIYDAAMQVPGGGTCRWSSSPARNTAPAARATGPPRARVCSACKAVVAQSFERIHRSNLVGMGVLPCQFKDGASAQTLGLDGTETFDVLGIESQASNRARSRRW